MFAALLDTCVLWPGLQRDFLLSLAAEGLYRPLWSAAILAELEYHEARKLVGRGVPRDEAQRRAVHLTSRMRAAFDDSEVCGWERLEGAYGLPDADDEHVVAAAAVGGAGAIVTHNAKDFPTDKLPDRLAAINPREFALNTVAVNPTRGLTAVERIAARSGVCGQRLTIDQVLETLDSRYGMAQAVERIRSAR